MQKIHVERDPKLKNTGGRQYSMVVGRFHPFHEGHRWLVEECLNDSKNVLICIRDIEPDEKNPFTSHHVLMNITNELMDLITGGKVKIMIIPDIESINFGQGVGYDIIEHIPPPNVRDISATNIRKKMKEEGLI
jgi:cytidyltransferase-like protein